jgi:hypothetical protein
MMTSRDKGQKTCWDGWFCITLPSGWALDEAGDVISLYDPNGAGAIAISMYSETTITDQASLTLAFRFAERRGVSENNVTLCETHDDLSVVEFSENHNERYWKIAAFHRAEQAVVMSYNSSSEDQGEDAEAVYSILKSFEWEIRS